MPGVGVVDGGSDGGGDGWPEDRVHGGGQGQGPGICGVVVEVSVQAVAAHLCHYNIQGQTLSSQEFSSAFSWKFYSETEAALLSLARCFKTFRRQSLNCYCLNCDCFLIVLEMLSSITIILSDIHNQEFPTLC